MNLFGTVLMEEHLPVLKMDVQTGLGTPRELETQFSRVSSADWEALLKVT